MGSHEEGWSPRLRDCRAQRGMTQQEVAEALERLAWAHHSRRVGVNADMVSKWERGQKSPSRFYLRLLCALFQVDAAGLGFGPCAAPAIVPSPALADGQPSDLVTAYDALDWSEAAVELLQPKLFELWRDELLSRRQMLRLLGVTPVLGHLGPADPMLSAGSAVRVPTFRGQETLAQLDELMHQLESQYHGTDPRRLLLPVRALIGTVEDLLPDVRGRETRESLLGVLARGNLLAGRLCFFDLHEPLNARAYLDLAREAAQQGANPVLTSVVFGHKAFLPAAKRNFPAGVSYLTTARESLSRQPLSLVSSWLSAVESELSTQAGLTNAALRSLSRANEELAHASTMPVPRWFDFFDEKRLRGFEGFALRKAGDPAGAREKLEAALRPGPQVTPKQRSVSMVDLAVTCVEGGDVDEGCRLATEAATVLHCAGYATAVDRLSEFQSALPDRRHPAARLLRESIAELS